MMAFSSVFLIWFRGRRESLCAGLPVSAGARRRRPGACSPASCCTAMHGRQSGPLTSGCPPSDGRPPTSSWPASSSTRLCRLCTPGCPTPTAKPPSTVPSSSALSPPRRPSMPSAAGSRAWTSSSPLGVIMALYGVVYAVLENDCRRLLAYHIISQVGYMVAGSAWARRWPSTAPAPMPSPTSSTRACSSWAAARCCT